MVFSLFSLSSEDIFKGVKIGMKFQVQSSKFKVSGLKFKVDGLVKSKFLDWNV